MRVSKCFGLLAAVLLIGGAALAQAPYVYVSNPDEEAIFAVDPAGGPGQTPIIVYSEPGSSYENLVVGPDELLYACDPSNQKVIRIDVSTSPVDTEVVYEGGGSGYWFQCGWFKNNGDLFVSDTAGSGVYSCAGVAAIPFVGGISLGCQPTPVDNLVFSGQGLTQTAIGDLLAVDQGGGNVWKLLIDPYTGIFQPDGEVLISGLDSPVGVTRSADGAIFVATANGLIQYDAEGHEMGECSEGFDRRDDLYFLDFAADDTLYVTTISNKGGKVWEMATDGCDCDGTTAAPDCSATEIFVFNKKSGFEPTAVGVAVPLTTDLALKDPFFGTQLFSFEDHAYELTAGTEGSTCEATVEAVEVSPACLDRLIGTVADLNDPDDPVVASPVLYNGDGGYGQLYFVNAVGGGCPPAEDGFYRHAISAYTEFLANPRMVRCPDPLGLDLCADPPPVECDVAELNSYFPFNGIFEGDGRIASKADTFSEYFLIEVALATGTTPGFFCGFETPFTNPPVPDGYTGYNDPNILNDPGFVAALPVFSNTESAPFKFKIAEITGYDGNGDPIYNCESGPYVTDATVLMSIARLREYPAIPGDPLVPVFVPTLVYSAGSSAVVDPAIFNEAENPTKTYHFNGKFPDPPYLPGVYQIVLVPLTDNFGAEVRYFKVQ